MHDSIASRTFNASDQHSFAMLSGDWNPMHMDPIAARRTQAGAVVVHGVHATLWALDRLAAAGLLSEEPTSLEARFQKFIYTDIEICLVVTRNTAKALYAELRAGDLVTTVIKVGFVAVENEPTEERETPIISASLEPENLQFEDLSKAAGTFAEAETDAVRTSFPHATKHFGATRIAAIAQLSTIVGMRCPGLHSIFSSFTLRLSADIAGNGLRYWTRSVDDRFNLVEMHVSAQGFSGVISAFLRQAPVPPPSLAELAASGFLKSDAFSGVTALIIGGSRGLGALTAKLIASGGGRVIITYCVGESEARAISEEIGSQACCVLRYDAREAALPQLETLEWEVDQLYYFATMHIAQQKAPRFSAAHFAAFCELYNNGFESVCMALCTRKGTQLAAFYPSTTFVEERPRGMTEYSMAKAAGELLCADLNRSVSNLHIVVKRLPRLLTDQNASIMPLETADPIQTMLPIIQELTTSFDRVPATA